MNEHYPITPEEEYVIPREETSSLSLSHERSRAALIESAKTADTITRVEHALLAMPRAVIAELEVSGSPEIAKALLSGALALGIIAAPEVGVAAQEAISIPAEHVAQFESQTGLKLKELAEKYGMHVDHSMVTPGAKTWVIHIGQFHDQFFSDMKESESIVSSQQKTYDVIEEIKKEGVDTIFDEGHTEDEGSVRASILRECEHARRGELVHGEEIYSVNDFFNTSVRAYIANPEHEKSGSNGNLLLQKLGAATMLGCEGKMHVLPAEDSKTNEATFGIVKFFDDKEEVMASYRKALMRAIDAGYAEAVRTSKSDVSVLDEYIFAVNQFLNQDFEAPHFDLDPMSTLLSKLSDKEVRRIFEEFNEKFEKTKNKEVRFNREIVALRNIGEYVRAHPETKMVPLVYGAMHNFVSALPAYNGSQPIKLNYIRMNTVDLKSGVHKVLGDE